METEEAAIAVALVAQPAMGLHYFSDSQAACCNYTSSKISNKPHHILNSLLALTLSIVFLWTLAGDESMRQSAGTCLRLSTCQLGTADRDPGRDLPGTFTTYLYSPLTAISFNSPYPTTPTQHSEAVAWRKLQTNTHPHLSYMYHAIHRTLYSYRCPHCDEYTSLYDTVWACAHTSNLLPILKPTPDQWEVVLTGSDPHNQLRLVGQAQQAIAAAGLVD